MMTFNKQCSAGMLTAELAREGIVHDGVQTSGGVTVVFSEDSRVSDVVERHVVVEIQPEELYNCQECGACCTEVNYDGDKLVQFGGTCSMLSGQVAGPCACKIYSTRPLPCRAMTPGSIGCQVLRVKVGLERT